ncbi:MAG: TraB/GumN family protein [Paracoccaceae bacterium]
MPLPRPSARFFRPLLLATGIGLLPFTPAFAQCVGQDLLQQPRFDALDAVVAADPYGAGNHWRATGDGATVHVIGTFHIFDNRMTGLMPGLSAVIETSDLLMLEAGPDEMQALQSELFANPGRMFITDGPTLPERLKEDEWQVLADELSQRGIPAFLGSKFRPWYVAMVLGMPPCAVPDITKPPEGLDKMLMDHAEGVQTPVKGLEPYDTVFGMFEDIAEDEQTEMLRASINLAAVGTDVYSTMADAYFREEHRLIWEFNRALSMEYGIGTPEQLREEFAMVEDRMLIRRNRAWIPVILSETKPGRQITVAVGAGHLPGKAGILALLAAEGFKMERMPF